MSSLSPLGALSRDQKEIHRLCTIGQLWAPCWGPKDLKEDRLRRCIRCAACTSAPQGSAIREGWGNGDDDDHGFPCLPALLVLFSSPVSLSVR